MKPIYVVLCALSMCVMSTQAEAKTIKHTIKNGETLYDIAHKNHTTIAEVEKVNHLKKDEILKIGRILTVPVNTYVSNHKQSVKVVHKTVKKKKRHRFSKHRIKKGETLYVIAHNNKTTIAELREINGLKHDEVLKIGGILKIPSNIEHMLHFVPKRKLAKTTHQSNHAKRVATASLKKATTYKKEKSSFSLRGLLFSSHKSTISKSSKITSLAKKKLGRRYVWGATGQKNTFDCSGFTTYVYKKNGIRLPRRAIAQSKYGKFIPRNKLQKGDLIFFDTSKRRRGYVNHVGIYLGNGKFIHASSAKKKVVITSLNKRFYSQRYKGARRPS